MRKQSNSINNPDNIGDMKNNKIVYTFLFILFCVIEILLYSFVHKQIKHMIFSEVEQYRTDIEEEINELMGYKNNITVGKLYRNAPEKIKINLKVFNGTFYSKLPDTTYLCVKNKRFISYFSEHYGFPFSVNKNQSHDIITQIDSLYAIEVFNLIWKVTNLEKRGSSLYISNMSPCAWGHKKVHLWEKQFLPTGYVACKNAFEYLINEVYKDSFTREFGKIDVILGLHNKYFKIDRNLEYPKNGWDDERKQWCCLSDFVCIHNRYYVVFYEKEPDLEYEICRKNNVIEKEIKYKTLNVFFPLTIVLLLILIVLIIYLEKQKVKKRRY